MVGMTTELARLALAALLTGGGDGSGAGAAPGDLSAAIVGARAAYVRIHVTHARVIEPDGSPTLAAGVRARQTVRSGVLLDDAGHVLTVGDELDVARLIAVELEGTAAGEMWVGSFVGWDPQSDVAVLRVDARDRPLPAFHRGDPPPPGTPLAALGNPFNLGTTVTTGSVTGLDRTISARGYECGHLMQLSLPLNPGDQGGPLVDAKGEIVGILLTRFQPEAGENVDGVEAHGISFALPIDDARRTARALIDAVRERDTKGGGKPSPWVGVRLVDIEDPVLRAHLQLAEGDGALIERVFRGSPAERAGLEKHDVVVEFAGERVLGVQHLGQLIRSTSVDQRVALVVVRAGQQKAIELVVGAME